jgi:WS/DGAT/MGAT family acyltransferase
VSESTAASTPSAPPEGDATTERRLTGQDAVFVYAETDTITMHTMGTIIIDPSDVPGGFGFDEMKQTVASRIHLLPPFRQRLMEIPLGLGHPILVDDPGFRVDDHLHRLAVPAPGGMRELAEIVGDLAVGALDRSKPLWEMWCIEGLERGRIALIMKMHHCMIDGASGSSQMASLMDLEPTPPLPETSPEVWDPAPLPGTLSLARRSLGSRLVGPLTIGRLVFDTAVAYRTRSRVTSEIEESRSESSSPDEGVPETSINGPISMRRKVAYGSVSLADVKRIKDAFGVTVNDAVLAASTLALRRYLEVRGELPDRPLYSAVPISLKSDGEKKEFSNKVSVLSIRLPVHLEDPAAVVRAVHRETSDAKALHQAVDEELIPRWLQHIPPLLTTAAANFASDPDLMSRVPPLWNVIVSNMMGPPIPLYFGGARVEAVYPMGPVSPGMGLNVTLLSNMGRLDIGVLTCPDLVPDPWEITNGYAEAFRLLLKCLDDEDLPPPDTSPRRSAKRAD